MKNVFKTVYFHAMQWINFLKGTDSFHIRTSLEAAELIKSKPGSMGDYVLDHEVLITTLCEKVSRRRGKQCF